MGWDEKGYIDYMHIARSTKILAHFFPTSRVLTMPKAKVLCGVELLGLHSCWEVVGADAERDLQEKNEETCGRKRGVW